MDDPGGGGSTSALFGSRYGLLMNTDDSDISMIQRTKNRRTKRPAQRDVTHEEMFQKQIRFDGRDNGGRFLVLKRTDEKESMTNISPFLIKKLIDNITPNVQISRYQGGALLLKTVDRFQAEKLKKQSKLCDQISVKIEDHATLNTSRGTIFCSDLKMLKDDEILVELKSSHVIAIKRLQRKTPSGELVDTGAFVLTFDRSFLPSSIDVGFYKCQVRTYIPPPMRCMKCLKFGHHKNDCLGKRMCADCAELYHEGTECLQKYKCIHCNGNHSALSRDCPKYVDEAEIQRIKVTEKISPREARQKRRSQVPNPIYSAPNLPVTYADALQSTSRTLPTKRNPRDSRRPSSPPSNQHSTTGTQDDMQHSTPNTSTQQPETPTDSPVESSTVQQISPTIDTEQNETAIKSPAAEGNEPTILTLDKPDNNNHQPATPMNISNALHPPVSGTATNPNETPTANIHWQLMNIFPPGGHRQYQDVRADSFASMLYQLGATKHVVDADDAMLVPPVALLVCIITNNLEPSRLTLALRNQVAQNTQACSRHYGSPDLPEPSRSKLEIIASLWFSGSSGTKSLKT
ncbi:uncharacterized protein LOC129738332 [Uranotaenia lowii]|uniref:uncharacterized protein LOC129738332 n=1 Tax=Uranotaenia lowii TaxID=190385 RepID=UPI00247AE067|nr:uncharacterized protein LOC129738332 [Uranotaenia lowii]